LKERKERYSSRKGGQERASNSGKKEIDKLPEVEREGNTWKGK